MEAEETIDYKELYELRTERHKALDETCHELHAENQKLKGLVLALRGHMEISSWSNREQRLVQMNLELEEEIAKLKGKL